MKKQFSVTNLKNVRKQNWPYITTWILYYAWVIVFTTWWVASPITDSLLGTGSRVLLHSLNLIASAIVVVVLKKEYFRISGVIGSITILFTAAFSLLVKDPQLHTIAIVLLAISLGIVNISILVPMVYIMNNTEKFVSILSTFLLISVVMLLEETGILNSANGFWFSFLALLVSVIPIFFFKSSDLDTSLPKDFNLIPKGKKVLYITVLMNCCYAIFCKGIGKSLVDSVINAIGYSLFPAYYTGALLGCVFYYGIYRFFKYANHITWNVTFAMFALAMVFYPLAQQQSMALAFAGMIGAASTMGMINMYYIVGVVGKKYWNYFYVKASVVLIGLCGGMAGTLLGSLFARSTFAFPYGGLPVLVFSVLIILLLIILSPVLENTYYKEDWASDSEKVDIDNEKVFRFADYHLNPRETQLCQYLLQGHTIRQSASLMNIQESTCNSYCKDLYRKLGINSRVELLNLFQD